MHVKKVLSDSKEKNKLKILENWSIFKEKTRLASSFLYRDYETKLFGVY
jgi:pterin-4a-carbinolamine dehydratase